MDGGTDKERVQYTTAAFRFAGIWVREVYKLALPWFESQCEQVAP